MVEAGADIFAYTNAIQPTLVKHLTDGRSCTDHSIGAGHHTDGQVFGNARTVARH